MKQIFEIDCDFHIVPQNIIDGIEPFHPDFKGTIKVRRIGEFSFLETFEQHYTKVPSLRLDGEKENQIINKNALSNRLREWFIKENYPEFLKSESLADFILSLNSSPKESEPMTFEEFKKKYYTDLHQYGCTEQRIFFEGYLLNFKQK